MKNLTPLLIVGTALMIVGAGCQQTHSVAQSPSSTATPMTSSSTPPTASSLKTDLEQIFRDTRALAKDPTPDRYLAAVYLEGSDKESVQEIKDGWANREQMLRTVMPDMTGENAKFIELKEEADWVGYYYLVKISDELAILKLQRFHKVAGQWKVSTGALTREPISAFTNFNPETLKQEIATSRIMSVKP